MSGVTNASAQFTFSGNAVAWIGTRATTRGKAYIYLDGVYKTTVDLYSATTLPRAAVASYYWPTSGTHTIKVVVVGTATRPKVDIDAFVRLS